MEMGTLIWLRPRGRKSTFLGRGDGTFTVGTSLAGGSSPESVAIGDFNGDGIPDLVVGCTYGFDVYLGRGDGTFTGPTAYGVTGSGNISSIQVADFNGDGHDDIAIAVHGYMVIGFVEIFFGNSSGTFTEPWLYNLRLKPRTNNRSWRFQ